MAISDGYLLTTKNLEAFLEALQVTQAPERFGIKFVKDMGFTSSNDQLYIKILKSLNFIDEAGVPLQRYFDYLDQTQSKAVLAQAIKEAYSDLFVINRDAWKLTKEEVQNKLRSLTQGKKSEKVLSLMANTFVALCGHADWESSRKIEKVDASKTANQEELLSKEEVVDAQTILPTQFKKTELHYNIQIHLPDSRDTKVFDAIFESLKKHLF